MSAKSCVHCNNDCHSDAFVLRRELADENQKYRDAMQKAFEYRTQLDEANERVAELKEELLVAEKLLEQRQRVLNAIPDCPTHGANCVPHAVEWVHQAKTR